MHFTRTYLCSTSVYRSRTMLQKAASTQHNRTVPFASINVMQHVRVPWLQRGIGVNLSRGRPTDKDLQGIHEYREIKWNAQTCTDDSSCVQSIQKISDTCPKNHSTCLWNKTACDKFTVRYSVLNLSLYHFNWNGQNMIKTVDLRAKVSLLHWHNEWADRRHAEQRPYHQNWMHPRKKHFWCIDDYPTNMHVCEFTREIYWHFRQSHLRFQLLARCECSRHDNCHFGLIDPRTCYHVVRSTVTVSAGSSFYQPPGTRIAFFLAVFCMLAKNIVMSVSVSTWSVAEGWSHGLLVLVSKTNCKKMLECFGVVERKLNNEKEKTQVVPLGIFPHPACLCLVWVVHVFLQRASNWNRKYTTVQMWWHALWFQLMHCCEAFQLPENSCIIDVSKTLHKRRDKKGFGFRDKTHSVRSWSKQGKPTAFHHIARSRWKQQCNSTHVISDWSCPCASVFFVHLRYSLNVFCLHLHVFAVCGPCLPTFYRVCVSGSSKSSHTLQKWFLWNHITIFRDLYMISQEPFLQCVNSLLPQWGHVREASWSQHGTRQYPKFVGFIMSVSCDPLPSMHGFLVTGT